MLTRFAKPSNQNHCQINHVSTYIVIYMHQLSLQAIECLCYYRIMYFTNSALTIYVHTTAKFQWEETLAYFKR